MCAAITRTQQTVVGQTDPVDKYTATIVTNPLTRTAVAIRTVDPSNPWVASLVYGSISESLITDAEIHLADAAVDNQSAANIWAVVEVAAIKVGKVSQLRRAGNARLRELLDSALSALGVPSDSVEVFLKAVTRYRADHIYKIVSTPSGKSFLHPKAADYGVAGLLSFSGGAALIDDDSWEDAKWTIYFLHLVKSADISFGAESGQKKKAIDPLKIMSFVDAQRAGHQYTTRIIVPNGTNLVRNQRALFDLMHLHYVSAGESHPVFNIDERILKYIEEDIPLSLPAAKAVVKAARAKMESQVNLKSELSKALVNRIADSIRTPTQEQTDLMSTLVTAKISELAKELL